MSSRRFVADLKPDPLLRKIVMLAACAAVLVGLVLLMRLPLPVPVRALLIALWLFTGLRQLGRHARGMQRVKAIRLQEGEATVIDRQGRPSPVRIMSGSVVLPKLAWLRLRCPDGLVIGELLRGDAATDKQWRHLQILWRQGAGPFGGGG
jgi:hypothetical protein